MGLSAGARHDANERVMRPMHIVTLAAALVLAGMPSAFGQSTPAAPNLAAIADGKSWTLIHATGERLDGEGRPAVRLTAEGDSANGIVGLALPVGVTFATGVIEVDLKGRNVRQQSFLGVAFNVADEKNFEAVYFRPFNFKADEPMRGRAVQYIAWPVDTWEHLRKTAPGRFEHALDPAPDPDGWFHARIEVTAREVRVFVNDAKMPALVVDRLRPGGIRRPAGLFVDSAEGVYANFRVAPDR